MNNFVNRFLNEQFAISIFNKHWWDHTEWVFKKTLPVLTKTVY